MRPVPEFITVEQATKGYQPKAGSIHALGPLDLAVRSGEFIAIVGPSGCGKSTLLLIASGLLDSTSGQVLIEGSRVTEPRTDVGIVFQTPALAAWRDVLGNVPLQVE